MSVVNAKVVVVMALGLWLGAGCAGDSGVGTPDAPPAPEAAAPGSAEALLDAAAARWAGSREALASEKGFHITGKALAFAAGAPNGIEFDVEVWTRYEPFASRSREYVSVKDPLTGATTASNETINIVNGDQGWRSDPNAPRRLIPDNEQARVTASAPTPRKVLLHREHHLTLELKGEEPIGELGGMPARRVLATDPSGLPIWLYIDGAGDLRKVTFQRENRSWVAIVFESYRPDGHDPSLSRLLTATYYVDGQKLRSYQWDRRTVNPQLDESLFNP